MSASAALPLLFLDVDGTLLPYGRTRPPADLEERSAWQHVGNPQLAEVDRARGPRLLALRCRPVWATAWMADANEVIAPLLGLPSWPVAELPEAPGEDHGDLLHWKTRPLVEAATGRPFVWVDDEITGLDRAWVARHHPGHALLHRVDPVTGLTTADFAVLGSWLRAPAAR
ncbi:HAD domain-containing protein [Streptomyces sp. N1]|uniref:HAD domain-containing protein n=1 Tax=Streptomyces sp. N1 TaxID=576456 RepID=UPI0010116775|nr:HAD domain-containing protein [Streptomyces sp. N1]